MADGVDEETGEVKVDFDALNALQMERDEKVENLALYVKDLVAEAKAIKGEEENLAKRRKVVERKAERAKEYLDYILGGEKFKTSKVSISYRTSKSVVPMEGFMEWAKQFAPQFLRYKEPEADKTAIKAALDNGEDVPNVEQVEKVSINIK